MLTLVQPLLMCWLTCAAFLAKTTPLHSQRCLRPRHYVKTSSDHLSPRVNLAQRSRVAHTHHSREPAILMRSAIPITSLFMALALAIPIPRQAPEQRLLVARPDNRLHHAAPPRPQGLFDAATNSVGVLFTRSMTNSDDEEIIHLWLPLGQKVYTRESHLFTLKLGTQD